MSDLITAIGLLLALCAAYACLCVAELCRKARDYFIIRIVREQAIHLASGDHTRLNQWMDEQRRGGK